MHPLFILIVFFIHVLLRKLMFSRDIIQYVIIISVLLTENAVEV